MGQVGWTHQVEEDLSYHHHLAYCGQIEDVLYLGYRMHVLKSAISVGLQQVALCLVTELNRGCR